MIRWLALAACVIANLCIGAAYAWSVFQKPLIDRFHWSTSATSLAFTISLGVVPFAMILAGKIQDKIGPRAVVFVGGIFYGGGMIGAGFTDSLSVLYWTYGVAGGIGIGTVYACTVANTVKWFPDKRGLASGLVVAGFGSGAVLFAPLATWLLEAYGVLAAFEILGMGHLVLIPLLALFIKPAPPGFVPENWTPPTSAHSTAATNKDWLGMLSDSKFYLLWCIYSLGASSGLMIIAHASPFSQEIIGLTPQTAAIAIAILALANTGGRIVWGWVSDHIGRLNAVVAMFAAGGTAMLVLPAVSGMAGFLLVLIVVGLCFGGFMGIYPPLIADAFGDRHLGMNYGIVFTAFGFAATVGPRLAATMKDLHHGDYSRAFLIAAAMNLIGIALTLWLIFKTRRNQRQRDD